jgi:hypothetical protein
MASQSDTPLFQTNPGLFDANACPTIEHFRPKFQYKSVTTPIARFVRTNRHLYEITISSQLVCRGADRGSIGSTSHFLDCDKQRMIRRSCTQRAGL